MHHLVIDTLTLRQALAVRAVAVVLACCFTTACERDADLSEPSVTFVSPAVGARFSVFDTIQLVVTVADESQIVFIKVSVVDKSIVPVLPTLVVYPSSKTYRLEAQIPVDNVHIASGTYYIMVTASDGRNDNNEFREIILDEAPLERKGIWCVTSAAGQPVVVSFDGTSFAPVLSLQGDYLASAVNSYDQQLYVCGRYTGNLTAVSLPAGGIAWAKSGGANLPWSTYEALMAYDRICYVSLRKGEVRGFDRGGITAFSALTFEAWYPERMAVHGKYLVNVQREVAGTARKLALINRSSGVGMQEKLLDSDPIRIFTRDSDHLLIFGNEGGQGLIREFTVSQNGFWEPHTLPPGRLYDAAQVDAGTYLLAHETGLYLYRYQVNSLTVFVPAVTPQRLTYDAVSNEVITAAGGTIAIYDYASGLLKTSATHTDSIMDVHVGYNK